MATRVGNNAVLLSPPAAPRLGAISSFPMLAPSALNFLSPPPLTQQTIIANSATNKIAPTAEDKK